MIRADGGEFEKLGSQMVEKRYFWIIFGWIEQVKRN